MKFVISILLIMLLSFSACIYFDWWMIAIAAVLVPVCIYQPPLKSFLSGFIALFLLWGGMAWWIDSANAHILSARLSVVLPFKGSSFLMILATALVGALVAGAAAMTGSYARQLSKK